MAPWPPLLTAPPLRMLSVPLPEPPGKKPGGARAPFAPRAAFADARRAAAGTADDEIAAIGPGGAGAIPRHGAGRAGIKADKAVVVAHRAAVTDVQSAVAGVTD